MFKTKSEAFEWLNSYCGDRKLELDGRRRNLGPLQKTYLIETSANGSSLEPFEDARATTREIEGGLWAWIDRNNRPLGWLEPFHEGRFWALYTNRHVGEVESHVNSIIEENSGLDHVWLSATALFAFWEKLKNQVPEHRYVRVSMQFDGELIRNIDPSVSEPDVSLGDDDEHSEWRSSFQLHEQLSFLDQIMSKIREIPLETFHAPRMLRVPSPVGGGHELFSEGKVTNRSPSFWNHRNYVSLLLQWYNQCTSEIEQLVWPAQDSHWADMNPVTIKFSKPLTSEVLENCVLKVFERGSRRFRVWGHPIRVGPSHIHFYGLDEHLWQEVFLEMTPEGITLVVPHGTCGNTVHRFVTNVQRFVDPRVGVWIGAVAYEDLLLRHLSQVMLYA